MAHINFDQDTLNSIVGGVSILDLPRLNVKSLEEASAFLKAYGLPFEPAVDESNEQKLWYYHRRAVVLLTERLKIPAENIPQILMEPKELGDLRKLLLFASQNQDRQLQKWACALLRVIHVFVHTENDLFSSFSEEIQKQILTPFQDCIIHDGTSGRVLLKSLNSENEEEIELTSFEVKPFKTSTSAVIKLLAKSDALAMNVYDKLGIRFVTKNIYDTFRVIQFFINNNLVSFPHIIPDQSSNNLYPVGLFVEAMSKISPEILSNDQKIESYLKDYLLRNVERGIIFRKENQFSGSDYKFIKFIARKMISIEESPDRRFSFFYPFEVQILDQNSFSEIQSGPSEHHAYKERQLEGARKRLFPDEEGL